MHTLRVEPFVVSHRKQLAQYVAANLCRTRKSGNPETITPTGDFDIKAALNLPQVFIKLAAEVGKAAIIGWLEDEVPRNLDSIQNLYL